MEEKIRVSLNKEINTKKLKIAKGTQGWAIKGRVVYKRKKPQKHKVYVLFDDGNKCDMEWNILSRNVEGENIGKVIKYEKRI
jgi:hypothetical protein